MRRQQFVSVDLSHTIEAVCRGRTRGYVLYGLASSWGSILFFAFIGLVLFGLRDLLSLDARTLTGYIVVFLYMVVPVEGILSALPAIAGARIAMQRVQQIRSGLSPEISPKTYVAEPFTSLAIVNMHYQYRGEDREHFSLGPLSLTFTPGEPDLLTMTTREKLILQGLRYADADPKDDRYV